MPRSLRISTCAAMLVLTAACTDSSAGDPTTGSTTGSSSTSAADPNPTTAAPTTAPDPTTGSSSDTGGDPSTSNSTSTASTTSGGPDVTSTGDTTGQVGPVGSAGCGLTPEAGDLEIEVQGQLAQYRVSLPADYDPAKPYPLGFGFHGRNRTGPNCHDGDCAGFQDVMHDQAILVYMTSLGGTGWEGDTERELNVEFFEKVLDNLTAGACIDESRVFAAGTSSGAHFVNILGCRFGDRLLAIAPVAGYLPEKDGCVADVAALVIHGFKDPHVPLSAGEEAREFWRARNGCSDTTAPTIAEVHAAAEAVPESHSCAVYDGCDAGLPVVWCEHSEGGYDDSTHGWPLFGGQQIWDFVQSL